MAGLEKLIWRGRLADVDFSLGRHLSRALDMSRWVAAGLVLLYHVRLNLLAEPASIPHEQRSEFVRLIYMLGDCGPQAVIWFFWSAARWSVLVVSALAYAWAFSRLTEAHTNRVRASLRALSRWTARAAVPLTVVLALIPHAWADNPPLQAPNDWQLTFADEFDTLDLSHWETKYPWGARHLDDGEQQLYIDPHYTGGADHPLGLNPFSVTDGVLTITADRVPSQIRPLMQGQSYTSGLLTTARSFSQLYGYFEMRAKFPSGRGLWPAFWMGTLGAWPPEIDVVECLGHDPTTLYATVHFHRPDGKPGSTGFNATVPDMSADFHTYGVLWSETFVSWYFDGSRVAFTPTPIDMHRPMYLLLNLAVGGNWPRSPDASTRFPASMQVDYVHAYAQPR